MPLSSMTRLPCSDLTTVPDLERVVLKQPSNCYLSVKLHFNGCYCTKISFNQKTEGANLYYSRLSACGIQLFFISFLFFIWKGCFKSSLLWSWVHGSNRHNIVSPTLKLTLFQVQGFFLCFSIYFSFYLTQQQLLFALGRAFEATSTRRF